jgi:hypothetical protein
MSFLMETPGEGEVPGFESININITRPIVFTNNLPSREGGTQGGYRDTATLYGATFEYEVSITWKSDPAQQTPWRYDLLLINSNLKNISRTVTFAQLLESLTQIEGETNFVKELVQVYVKVVVKHNGVEKDATAVINFGANSNMEILTGILFTEANISAQVVQSD